MFSALCERITVCACRTSTHPKSCPRTLPDGLGKTPKSLSPEAQTAQKAAKPPVCGGYDGAQNLSDCERLDPVQGPPGLRDLAGLRVYHDLTSDASEGSEKEGSFRQGVSVSASVTSFLVESFQTRCKKAVSGKVEELGACLRMVNGELPISLQRTMDFAFIRV